MGVLMGITRQVAAGLLVFAAASCGATDPTIEAPTSSETSAEAAMSPEARYLATVSAMVEGTEYEGLPEADPQGFLATADTICQMMDNGASWDDVLARYLEELQAARGAETDDDAVLAGTLVGAAVETFCPEYADELP
jgi:hypothetical protein